MGPGGASAVILMPTRRISPSLAASSSGGIALPLAPKYVNSTAVIPSASGWAPLVPDQPPPQEDHRWRRRTGGLAERSSRYSIFLLLPSPFVSPMNAILLMSAV